MRVMMIRQDRPPNVDKTWRYLTYIDRFLEDCAQDVLSKRKGKYIEGPNRTESTAQQKEGREFRSQR